MTQAAASRMRETVGEPDTASMFRLSPKEAKHG